jgi:hypothetical protein
VNGTSVPFSFKKELLVLEHQMDPGGQIDVEILDGSQPVRSAAKNAGMSYAFGVALRRALSEVRDNAFAKHPRLRKLKDRPEFTRLVNSFLNSFR